MYIIFQCNSALKIILYIDNLLIKRERNNFALINSAQNILKMGKKQFIKVFIIFLCTFSASGIFAHKQVFEFFAHRGSRLEFDENTMQAFRASYEAGMRGYETDVRLTKDGDMVLSHDATLARISPCQKEVESMSTDEVKQVRTFKGNKLVFLQELVDYLADKDSMYVEFEMKTNDPIKYYPTDKLRDYCDKLYKTTMAKKPAHSLYLFTSGDKAALNMMRFLHPNAELLYISGKPINEETILTAIDMGIKRLGCSLQGTSKQMVDLAHKAGISVSLWPNASREDIMLGVYLGADALCCDRALEIKKFLDTKAPWIKYK